MRGMVLMLLYLSIGGLLSDIAAQPNEQKSLFIAFLWPIPVSIILIDWLYNLFKKLWR